MSVRPSLRLRRGLALATVAAACGAAAVLPAVAGAAPLRGIQIAKVGEGNPISDLDNAKALGAQLVRTEIRWNLLEPSGAGQLDETVLRQADDLMAGARARGLKVLLTVNGTPCWASSAPAALRGGCGSAEERRKAAVYPPADPASYTAIAGFIAERYAASLGAFEVWNEPDHVNEAYFAGPDKAQRYAALLKATYPVVKRAAPGLPVLAGSIVGSNGVFLKALYRFGIKGSYDALSVHYYDLVLASLRAIRQTQRANGDSKPLWLAEFGWTSCLPKRTEGGHNCVDRKAQGANVVDIYRALARTSYVRAAVVYTLQDTTQYAFGVLDRQGRRKPAFVALQRAWARPSGRLRAVSLRVSRAGGRRVASGRGPVGDALQLDVFQGRTLRYKAVFRLDRAGAYRIVLPGFVRRGMTVRVYQYWSGAAARRIVR